MPDRTQTIALMAARFYDRGIQIQIDAAKNGLQVGSIPIAMAVGDALAIYREAERQVQAAYRTTSTDLPACICNGHFNRDRYGADTHRSDCPRHQ